MCPPKASVVKTDIAWLAGIVDGEGCIVVHHPKNRRCYQLRLQITNSDLGILSEVKRILNKWLVPYSIFEASRNHPKCKICYHIQVCRQEEIKFVLKKVMPYLKGEKRNKAEFAIEKINKAIRYDGRQSNRRKKVMQDSYIRLRL